MIITRTPFRITLGGGGTDLPSFYKDHGGYVFTMAINKYMYIMLNRRSVADRKIVIRYSQVETVDSVDEISHPLAREALRLHGVRENIELTSVADMPARTGLGSSGSYLVGLLTAIRAYKRESAPLADIAEEACHIEMDILKEPVGKQDQYIAAFGGFKVLEIGQGGQVAVENVHVDFPTANELVTKARMYYTGVQRSATAVLKSQDAATRDSGRKDHAKVVDCLQHIKDLGRQIRDAFEAKDLDRFGTLMDEHWRYKKQMSASISLSVLEQLYDQVKKDFGVLGGKIIGAGGGGFLMLYCPSQGRALDGFMAKHEMPRVSYFPTQQGSKVVSDMTSSEDFDAA
ncbi:MAG: D-glycero-alpha-D-manno-heptose 7-phosphate kinase [Verrucomicrobia bacterium ADurb.Bin345]|nr:MAG: D-glycero-alpha-D-manno-heptose 7-phosphate kinase [Verrucomicrobia bacterium ADurb.Bin345]